MQAEYRRDTHHSYLVLYEDEKEKRESFQTRMFLENAVPGFLPCRRYDIDCSGRFFYDISSRQSLASILATRSMNRKLLEILITSLLKALNGLQEYLLDAGGICLKAEWIYCDPACTSFAFCYYPDEDLNWDRQLQLLAEYLLPHLEHKNREAVRMGYALYQYAMEGKNTAAELEQLLRCQMTEEQEEYQEEQLEAGQEEPLWEQKECQMPVSTRFQTQRQQMKSQGMRSQMRNPAGEELPVNRDQLLDSFFQEEPESGERERHRIASLLSDRVPFPEGILTGTAGGTVSLVLFFNGFPIPAAVLTGGTLLLLLFLAVRRWKKTREQQREVEMEQYVMVQDWLEEEKQEERLQEEKQRKQELQEEPSFDENATCILTSEAVYNRLAKGYLVPELSSGGQTIPVNKEVTMIGKSNQMDVVLSGVGVSRNHARIIIRGDQCFLADLNSRNGTRINGVLLKPQEEQLLSDGDRISFANIGYEWRCYRL
ncbi:MAG: DUF6382 domain-containing protein [Lachnospiraceae bacterium]|nr:DUF6382 domain-containing protein [Lachnospiraceae bacterium]